MFPPAGGFQGCRDQDDPWPASRKLRFHQTRKRGSTRNQPRVRQGENMRKEALWGLCALLGTIGWLAATPARLGAG
jgi:hypothetical protein